MNFNLDSLTFGRIANKSQTKQEVNQKAKSQKITHFWDSKAFKPVMGVASLICIALISFGAYAQAHENKIFPGIKIAGIDLGGKTKPEAEKILTQQVEAWQEQKFTAQVGDNKIETNLTGVGIAYSPQELTEKAYKVGHSNNWFVNIKDIADLTYQSKSLDSEFQLNEDSWNNFLNQLTSKIEQKAEIPHLEIQEGQIKLVLGKPGITIETDKLKNGILEKVKSNDFNPIDVPIITTQITIPEDQAKTIVSQAENYTQPISYAYESRTYWAQKQDILNWLIINNNDGNFTLSVSDSAINTFIAGIAYKIDKAAVSKEINPSGQVLKEGVPGLALNRTDAFNKTKSALNNGSRQIPLVASAIEPKTKTIYPDGTPGLFPGRYIEISLSKQKLYAWDGESFVGAFAISSGLPGTPTPMGTFHIYSKSRVTRMTGPGYDLPGVEWVSWFSGDYSIHGTYWHNNFGHPMSHGCVNASNGNAAFIYDWAPVGTPVYIH